MNPEYFNMVDAAPDGDCFFRCVTIHMNKILQDSRRGRNNQLLNKSLKELEQSTMLAIRLMTVNSIEMEKDKYEKEIFYDGELYDSIQDRIENMYKKGEFVGFLEVKKLSQLFNIQINIFSPIKNQQTRRTKIMYNHISTFGTNQGNICNLFLQDNHYDLLLVKPKYQKTYNDIMNSYLSDIESPQSLLVSHSSTSSIESEFDFEIVENASTD